MKRRTEDGGEELLLQLKRRRFGDHPSGSCCSSNVSTGISKQKVPINDLEEGSSGGVEMAETATFNDEERERSKTRSFGDLEVEETKMEPNVAPPSTEEGKTPSNAELEDFFSAAEKEVQSKFSIKYNFDFVKEKALEGRYEWVGVKP